MAEPYEPGVPYIPSYTNNAAASSSRQDSPPRNGTGGTTTPRSANSRIANMQSQRNKPMGIMKNASKINARRESLDDIEEKTIASSQNFRNGAMQAQKRIWWRNTKIRICIGIGIAVLIIIIIVPIVGASEDSTNNYYSNY